jgi:hypothetical protein
MTDTSLTMNYRYQAYGCLTNGQFKLHFGTNVPLAATIAKKGRNPFSVPAGARSAQGGKIKNAVQRKPNGIWLGTVFTYQSEP